MPTCQKLAKGQCAICSVVEILHPSVLWHPVGYDPGVAMRAQTHQAIGDSADVLLKIQCRWREPATVSGHQCR